MCNPPPHSFAAHFIHHRRIILCKGETLQLTFSELARFHGFRVHSTISNQKDGSFYAPFISQAATFTLKFPQIHFTIPDFPFGSCHSPEFDQEPLCTLRAAPCRAVFYIKDVCNDDLHG